MNRYITSVLLLIIALSSINLAYSESSVKSLLLYYNVPSQTIGTLTFVNVTHGTSTYAALYKNNALYLVVNVTPSQYVLITNKNEIMGIMRNKLINDSIAAANLTALKAKMLKYINTSSTQLNECLSLTGLSRGYTCTVANNCQSCQVVPSCNKVLYATNGPTGALGYGIAIFDAQYSALNSSINAFMSAISNVNSSNAASNIGIISSSELNISNLTSKIYQNTVFPPTQNITSAMLSVCTSYHSITSAPWYCYAIGYCGSLNYNYSALYQINAQVATVAALPFSNSSIETIANNVANNAAAYVDPVVNKQKLSQLNLVLNTTLLNYSGLVNKTNVLLSHVSNAIISNELLIMQSNYSNMLANYVTENISAVQQNLSMQMVQLQRDYAAQNALYTEVVTLSENNTKYLIAAQLDTGHLDPNVASLAFRQIDVSQSISGAISNLSLAKQQLTALSQASKSAYYSSIPLISITDLGRFFGSWTAKLMGSSSASFNSNVALAPVYGASMSFIIGIIFLLALFVMYVLLNSKKKIMKNSTAKSNWHKMFILVFATTVLYTIITFGIDYMAATNSPYYTFNNAVNSASKVVIAANSTSAAVNNCALAIANSITARNKTAIIAHVNPTSCVYSNYSGTFDDCMNAFAKENTPVILISSSNTNSISAYSFFGTVLYLSGNSTFINTCIPSILLR